MAGLGIVGTALAGAAVGIGTEGAKFMSATFLKEQEAEIQKLRDERRTEFESGQAALGREHQTGIVERQIAASAGEAEKGRTFQSGESEKGRTFQSGESEKGRTFQSGEAEKTRTFTAGESEKDRKLRSQQISQQAAQIELEGRKVKVLEEAAVLDKKQKEAIDKAREAYMAEKDPDKKHELGATYLTLLGKVGERYKELSETDAMGNKKTVGFFDTLSGKEVGRTAGKTTDSGGRPPLSSFSGQKAAPAAGLVATKAAPTPAVPVPTTVGISEDEFNVMVRDAARNGTRGKEYLREKLASGLLNVRQRIAAQNALR